MTRSDSSGRNVEGTREVRWRSETFDEPIDIGRHSDSDGDSWLHSDDPASADWILVAVGSAPGEGRPRVECLRGDVWFPAISRAAVSAWLPPDSWIEQDHYCHFELTDERGCTGILYGPGLRAIGSTGMCLHLLASAGDGHDDASGVSD